MRTLHRWPRRVLAAKTTPNLRCLKKLNRKELVLALRVPPLERVMKMPRNGRPRPLKSRNNHWPIFDARLLQPPNKAIVVLPEPLVKLSADGIRAIIRRFLFATATSDVATQSKCPPAQIFLLKICSRGYDGQQCIGLFHGSQGSLQRSLQR